MSVLLTTLNSKYIHSSLALRYLRAWGRTKGQAYDMEEYTINMPVLDILSRITEHKYDLVGFACYIWNIDMTLHLVSLLKEVRPEVTIVLGGPEVTYNSDEILQKNPAVDFIIRGEGEEAFTKLVEALGNIEENKIEEDKAVQIPGVRYRLDGEPAGSLEIVEVRDLSLIPFPYEEADLTDMEHRILYYESSRGCPFSCSYCLSGNRNTVRFFPVERTIGELQWFMDHQVKQVKFVDRTFNCAPHHHLPIMEFIHKAHTTTNFHLEMEAELIGAQEVKLLTTAPAGRMQIEVGVQSTYEKTLTAISRHNDWEHIKAVMLPIINSGRTHVHMDLIIGLPYEDMKHFARSFNDLFSLQPQALQLGFLKLLKGSGVRAMTEYEYRSDPKAPYEVLATHVMSYEEIRFLKVFEDVFERFYNSEKYRHVFQWLHKKLTADQGDAFSWFSRLTEAWLAAKNHMRKLTDTDQILFLYRFLTGTEAKGSEGNLANAETCSIDGKSNTVANLANTEACSIAGKMNAVAIELLRYDVLLTFKGKIIIPDIGLSRQHKEKLQASEAFWKEEALVRRYIPDYQFKEWRRIRQDFHELSLSEEAARFLDLPSLEEQEKTDQSGQTIYIIDVTGVYRPFPLPVGSAGRNEARAHE